MNEFSPSLHSISNLKYKDYANLSRLAKGYLYEMDIQTILEEKDIAYTGNPKQYEEWIKHTNTGHDIMIKSPKGSITVEAKFTLTRIAHSWFNRD